MSTAPANSFPRIARPNRIRRQLIHVHLRMPYQRNSFMDRLGSDESVAV